MHGVMAFLSAGLIIAGFVFILFGIIGVLRLPDFYSRLHAQGKCDTVGVALMLGGLALYKFHQGFNVDSLLVFLKIMAVLFFIALANPTATHALGRAARMSGLKPWAKGDKEEDE